MEFRSVWACYSCRMNRLVVAENIVQSKLSCNMDSADPMPSPHGLSRGKACRSMRATRKPRVAAIYAATDPAGPAPTTATSKISFTGLSLSHGIERPRAPFRRLGGAVAEPDPTYRSLDFPLEFLWRPGT